MWFQKNTKSCSINILEERVQLIYLMPGIDTYTKVALEGRIELSF